MVSFWLMRFLPSESLEMLFSINIRWAYRPIHWAAVRVI